MSIYEKPVWQLMWEMAKDLKLKKGEPFQKQAALEWFNKNYPKIKNNTISAHLTRMSTNAPSRVHYKAKAESDLLYQIDDQTFRLFDVENDPAPIYDKIIPTPKRTNIYKSSLKQKIIDLVNDFELDWDKKFAELEKSIAELSNDNERLQNELSREPSWLDAVQDNELKDRLSRFGSAPLDALIREAGVMLEHRLRRLGNVDKDLGGIRLVEAVLGKDNGILVFSSHPGEQEGVMMLYRGAMQFIRNPPMHHLIDYKDQTALLSIRLIDILLQFLTELEPRRRDEISFDAVCNMLRRRPIPKGILNLFIHLYRVGDEWISYSNLADALDIEKAQLSGVLGALGTRINKTSGLEGKGGTLTVLEIKSINDEWHYRMLPILRRALEFESIVK